LPEPEARARKDIDRLLTAAGWVVQDRDQFNRLETAHKQFRAVAEALSKE
jgi:hypothetical protein